MKKITIIIPVYNVENYLEKCLNSILNQTFKDFNVILVDDGSTDGTGKICDEFKKIDSRISVIHKKNEGVSIARNVAIEKAEGEYILFFDGDDYVEPYTLEELYKTAKRENVDAVLYGYYLSENGKILETHIPSFKKDYYEKDEIIKEVIPKFIGVSYDDINKWLNGEKDALKKENTALWRSMVKGDLIRNNHLRFDKNLKVGEDTCFTTEYLSYAKNCYIIKKCYYYLVVRSTSTIFVYEKNPLSKLEGKTALLKARRSLTERIKSRLNVDIQNLWYGTVVMSSIQLAFELSGKDAKESFFYRYNCFKKYVKEDESKNAIKNLKIKLKGGIKIIPFVLLKLNLYFLLFLCTYLLNIFNYKFER